MFKNKKTVKNKETTDAKMEKHFEPTEDQLREMFKHSADVFFHQTIFHDKDPIKVIIMGCEGLIDNSLLNDIVFARLSLFFNRDMPAASLLQKEEILKYLHLPQLKEVTNKEELTKDLFSGHALILFEGHPTLYSANLCNRPQRNPEETMTEVTVMGPRDNFIEDLSINIALIRKRLRSNTLNIQTYEIGKRTLTKVAVLYMDEIANPEMVQKLKDRLEKVDVDGIYSGNQLMELIEKTNIIIPRHYYTGRPDQALHFLLKGRIIILVDGVSYAMMTPINVFVFLKSSEDKEYISGYATYERLLRFFGAFIAAFLPGFWVALTTFHQDQIPFILLATVVESRQGLPFPTAFEALIMVTLFEVFREAGVRLPTAVGQTIGVLGALIIGDAAIRSGLTSPAMLVIIACSIISTFTLVNQSVIGGISILRFISIISAAFLGLFGYFYFILFLFTHLSIIRILGVPFLEITANLSLSTLMKALLRLPASLIHTRPASMFSEDPTEKGSDDQK